MKYVVQVSVMILYKTGLFYQGEWYGKLHTDHTDLVCFTFYTEKENYCTLIFLITFCVFLVHVLEICEINIQ